MEGGIEKCLATIKANKLDALITIGGDDTQGVTNALIQAGVQGVGVPKTIDNDLNGTDACFGFDTAVIDRHRGRSTACTPPPNPTTA